MIVREKYLEQIRPLINKPFIKVLTGIRRCGKSIILKQLIDLFRTSGIHESRIIYYNFESLEHIEIDGYLKLYTEIKSKIIDNDRYYILLDEIQEVKEWEKAVNSLLADSNVDMYITGSNSKLLSSELATYISGRYVDFQISTLSFEEYILFKETRTAQKITNIYSEFEIYIRFGGFPAIHLADYDSDTIYKIVNDIYSSVILRDTIQRYNIRNFDILERLVKFVFENVGNRFSAKNIADYFKSQQRKIDLNTIYNYLKALEGAFIIQRVARYDIRGKEVLQTNEKYFVSDVSLIYAVLGYRDRFISGILENIVMLELKRRGYAVYVGKVEEKEVDFIAEKKNEKIYVQVTYKMVETQTIEREFGAFKAINDNYPKYVVSMDEFWNDNVEGIKHIHIANFLLMENY
ncbi:MAG TPA: ATP-binding protein [Paludibacter sp.]|nr:ATP-binding protein [Paludibacter sp.]